MVDDFITETVPQDAFSSAHRDMGGWELVTEEECKRLQSLAESQRASYTLTKQVAMDIQADTRVIEATKEAALKAEYGEFKAWKAMKEGK